MTTFERFYKLHPVLGMRLENAFYNYADKVSEQYNGATWNILVDDEDVYSVYPDVDFKFVIGNSNNYVDAKELSPEGFGVYVSLIMYNSLCWQLHAANDPLCETFSSMYHSLRIWMMDKSELPPEEVAHILRLID